MSDLSKPLYTLTIGEFVALAEKIVRQVLNETRPEGSPAVQSDDCMSIAECAVFLNCSKVSIHTYKNNGLPFYRVGRKVLFKKAEVLDFMSRHAHGKRKAIYINNTKPVK